MGTKRLRKGFTTGAASSAAVKAALVKLLSGTRPDVVEIRFLTGETRTVPVEKITSISDHCCEAVIIKDAGDDPDVTHKAEIGARVTLLPQKKLDVVIRGGIGVGTVTKPGLEVAVGEPAINSGPRKMIHEAVETVFRQLSVETCFCVDIEIFVPEGEVLAQKTLNARLGILGGISILGTTGIVRPLSHDAYIATIRSAISVAKARGIHGLVFTTGRRSERLAMDLFPDLSEEAFIQTGDFFKAAIDEAVKKQIRHITYAVFFGKAVKMALGFAHTHAAKSELTMERLAGWAQTLTGNRPLVETIKAANTARHAFAYIYPDYPEILSYVGGKILETTGQFSEDHIRFRVLVFDFDGCPAYDSATADIHSGRGPGAGKK